MSTNSVCIAPFPSMHGWQAVVGPFFQPVPFFEAHLGIGVGRYYSDDARLLTPLRKIVVAEGAFFPFSHVGLAATIDPASLNRYSANGFSLRSAAVAIRLRN